MKKKCIALQKQSIKLPPTISTTKCEDGSCNLIQDGIGAHKITGSFEKTESFLSKWKIN